MPSLRTVDPQLPLVSMIIESDNAIVDLYRFSRVEAPALTFPFKGNGQRIFEERKTITAPLELRHMRTVKLHCDSHSYIWEQEDALQFFSSLKPFQYLQLRLFSSSQVW